jgi:type I restriction enzyme M protein
MSSKTHTDFNLFSAEAEKIFLEKNISLSSSEKKTLLRGLSWRDENASPVIAKIFTSTKELEDPMFGKFAVERDGKNLIVKFEPDSELTEYEQVPLSEPEGVIGYFSREIHPYLKDAWIEQTDESIGYEISFSRHFYKPKKLRELAEIEADIEVALKQGDGLVRSLLVDGNGTDV